MWFKNKKNKPNKSPEPARDAAASESEKRISEALRKFYEASLGPLRQYQVRMTEIAQEFDADLAPYQSVVDSAKNLLEQRREELRESEMQISPELNAAYNAMVTAVYANQKYMTAPHQSLRELARKLAESLFNEVFVPADLTEPRDTYESGLGLTAAVEYRIDGNVETLSPMKTTRYLADDLVHEAFRESLKPHDELLKQRLAPIETAHRKAVNEAGLSARAKYDEAIEQLKKVEKEFNAAKREFRKKYFLARVQARQDCEVLLQPLREELEIALKKEFSALND
jgi:prefoldin subunit 5